ncbi:hypothetical protein QA648_17930 [Rhizobium sp. CB3171]|uniref:hypothetical protein n=1 Tax=Rhizobium sp. CB3171 TaxID=3039157 RepID=UPI0024B03C9E|nr:hypothetical protein [Rhizobium sp. CB3171]WFU01956.1 hypothetical protein QA648_17930 [Rhizobium sp. CB3171]
MFTEKHLEIFANIAAILTAVIAVWAYGRFLWERRQKRLRLESHLRDEKEMRADEGQRTLLHLVANLGMSEIEIVDAAFRSKVIRRRVSLDEQGRADRLLLEYESGNPDADFPRRGRRSPRF